MYQMARLDFVTIEIVQFLHDKLNMSHSACSSRIYPFSIPSLIFEDNV